MLVLEDHGFSKEELIRLNQVRCYQQVLFLSDVLDTSGRALDRRYLRQRPTDEVWSTLLFPQESPSYQDVHLWQQALHLLAPRDRALHWLGQFKAKGHKIWEWRLDTDQEQLYQIRGPIMDMYMPSDTEGRTRRGNRWYCAQRAIPREDKGIVCSVSEHGGGDVSIDCRAEESWSSISTLDFWGVLHKW